jgi:hypothetical protein
MSPKELQQLLGPRETDQPPTANPSRLRDLAQKANALAVEVEERWEELPEDKRELLTAFAYAIIEPPQGIQWKLLSLIDRVSAVWNILAIALKGELNAFVVYAGAYQRLLNAILGAIERADEAYQTALSEALEETFKNLENTQVMTGEEACEWIRDISYQAFREL